MGTAVAPSAHGIRTRRLHGVRSGGAGRRGRGSAADCRPFRAAVTHPAQTIKFSPAFFKRLRGIKGGGAPFCSALRAMRSRKDCASQNSEAFFGGPVHKAPPGRQKSEREFCLFGGFFCVRRAAPCAGLAVLARLTAVAAAFVTGAPAFFPPVCRCLVPNRRAGHRFLFGLRCRRPAAVCGTSAGAPAFCIFVPGPRAVPPAAFVRIFAPAALFARRALSCTHFCLVLAALFARPVLCARVFLLSFTLSCLTSSSQNSFHLSLRPRRASTFFRKESRQRFARGAAPSNPSDGALRPIFSPSALLAGLAALRPQTAG